MTTFKLATILEQQRSSHIREQLKLRQRPTGEWEVYTVVHGSDLFRWFIISHDKALWYTMYFPDIPTVPFTGD